MTDWNSLINKMRIHGIKFSEPLSENETVSVEERYGFKFPCDLMEFLQTGMPIGNRFPNWRSSDHEQLLTWLNQPREGILFSVENDFWLDEWGKRPDDLTEAKSIVNKFVDDAPTLIPIYEHSFIPTVPTAEGNPVYHVLDTDINVAGTNLKECFTREFLWEEYKEYYKSEYVKSDWGELLIDYSKVRPIQFWDSLIPR